MRQVQKFRICGFPHVLLAAGSFPTAERNHSMLALYLSPGFSSMAPHITLHEIGIKFETRWISFEKQEQHAPDYLALNPEGKVPTLLVNGRALTEVAAILYFLAKRFPTANLVPADDLEAQAHIISWMSFVASTIHPARRISGVRAERYLFEGSMGRWNEVFGIAEKRLGGRDWAGGSYSIADIHLFRLYWRFVESAHPAPDTFPGLSAHYDRMLARPAVRRVLEIESAMGYYAPQ
jgi:glutathione S-transferase